ncbi:MAG: hypothetical protein AABW72_04145 [archaeon]
MELKIDSNLSNILLAIAVLYILFITDALGKIGILLNGITHSTFQGVDAMLILFLVITALLIYYSSSKSKKASHEEHHEH